MVHLFVVLNKTLNSGTLTTTKSKNRANMIRKDYEMNPLPSFAARTHTSHQKQDKLRTGRGQPLCQTRLLCVCLVLALTLCGCSGASSGASTTATPSPTTENRTAPVAVRYIVNINSKIIHLPSCHYVDQMCAENKLESGETLAALRAQGYEDCKVCEP